MYQVQFPRLIKSSRARWALPLLFVSSLLAAQSEFESRETHLEWEAVAGEGAQYREIHAEAIAALNAGKASKAEADLRKIIDWCESKKESGKAKVVAVSTAQESELYLASAGNNLPIVWVDVVCPASYKSLAFLYVNRGDVDSALRNLERASTIAPYWAEPYTEQGYILNQLRRFDSAKVAYQQALDLATAHEGSSYVIPVALRGLGFTLIELGDLNAAQAAFEKSLTLDPGNEIAKGELQYIASLREKAK